MTVTYALVQNTGGNEAELLAANSIPLDREIVVAPDTGRLWIGDGQRTLQSLPSLLPGGGGGSSAAVINDNSVSTSTTYSSAQIASLLSSLQNGGSSSLVNLEAIVQNTDGTYPTTGSPVTVYAGSTPPDPTTLTGPAFFILTSTT